MVYFVWDSGSNAIKIGFSEDVLGRLAELQVGNPNALFLLGTIDGDEGTERAIHARFARLRILGEWFRAKQPLLRFIKRTLDGSVSIEPKQTTARVWTALAWLEDRFREQREWTSTDLQAAARDVGISRNALFASEVQDLPIRKTRRLGADGNMCWTWIAEEGWPF